MKKLLFLLILNSFLATFARSSSGTIKFIYTYSTGISVERVTTTKKATVVDFLWKGDKGDRISVPSDCWLIGADKALHALKSINGARPGVMTSPKAGYKKKFSMVFEPLASTDTVFDIVSRHDFLKYFCFYGVHDSSVTPSIHRAGNVHLLEAGKDYGKGLTRIKGHIYNYGKDIDEMSMYYLSADTLFDNNMGSHAKIDSLGNFCLDICIEYPMFCYLRFGYSHLPVFLYPNDSITCNIYDLSKYSQRMVCHSSKGNNLHEGFLQADPYGPMFEWITSNRSQQPSFYQDFFNSAEQDMATFLGYIAGKYQLSDEEYHLLFLNGMQRLKLTKLIVGNRFPDELGELQTPDPEDDPCRYACPEFCGYETFIRINPSYVKE